MKKILLLLGIFIWTIYSANPFIGIWQTDANKKIDIVMNSQVYYEYENVLNSTINGSGTSDRISLTLPINGKYKIKIFPQNSGFRFNYNQYSGSDLYFLEIINWGQINWNDNLSNLFNNKVNLTISATDIPNFSNVTDFSYMFYNCKMISNIPNINLWNVSNSTTFKRMFSEADLYNSPINNWDTHNALTLESMFNGALSFNQPIDQWNISKVENLFGMFSGAKNFNQNISTWNTSKVKRMDNMFYGASSFNQNISNWDTSQVENMSGMFQNASVFNQNLGAFNLKSVKFLNDMLSYCNLDCNNYRLTLKGWSENINTPNNITLGARWRRYENQGLLERNKLTLFKFWNITGDLQDNDYCQFLSVDENLAKTEIAVYPNPFTDFLNINTNEKISSIEFYNQNGQKTERIITNSKIQNLKNLQNGVYLIKIITSSNKYFIKKVIKK